MSTEEFKTVTYKRKSRKSVAIHQQLANLSIDTDYFDKDKTIRRILDAKDEIFTSDYYTNVQSSLNEALKHINNQPNVFVELICFGIGHITNCLISRYQFALVLLLKTTYNIDIIKVCDPILTKHDITIIEHFNIEIINENIEAKYKATNVTLFYLPHCPKQLSNNLLWANWSKEQTLEKCIIFCNSFQSLVQSNTEKHLRDNSAYILKVLPHVKEIPVANNFKYNDVFNDGAVHIFPNLEIGDDFWLDCKEPKYLDDVEYIKAKDVLK